MPERKTLNRTYSVGDQVPTCPVFTRAKIKSRFGILVNLPSQYYLPKDQSCQYYLIWGKVISILSHLQISHIYTLSLEDQSCQHTISPEDQSCQYYPIWWSVMLILFHLKINHVNTISLNNQCHNPLTWGSVITILSHLMISHDNTISPV